MSDELSLLRGAVRDGVASIENLGNVLRSRRVGPRVIGRALPEVRAGCLALNGAIERLRGELRQVLADDGSGLEAADEMLEHASLHVAQLAAELGRYESDVLDARERIALDEAVRRVAGELAGLVRVLDLLSVAVQRRATAIELAEVLAHKRTLMGAPSAPVTVTVDLGSVPTLVGDAFVVLDLVLFAFGTVIRAGVASPFLGVRIADDRVVLELGRPPAELPPTAKKRIIDVPVRTPLPRELEVIAAAARRARIEISWDPERTLFRLAL